MISAEDWEDIKETLLLNTNEAVRESILETMKAPLEVFVEDIGWNIK